MEFTDVVADDGRLPGDGVRTNVPFKDLTEREKKLFFMVRQRRNIFFTRPKVPIRLGSSILPITMRYIP